jgi:hypothetical protein
MRVGEARMMCGDRMRDDVRDHSVVGRGRQALDLLRAGRRMIHPVADAVEAPLEGGRMFFEIMKKARERGRPRRTELRAARPRGFRHGAQALGDGLPLPLVAVSKRMRVEGWLRLLLHDQAAACRGSHRVSSMNSSNRPVLRMRPALVAARCMITPLLFLSQRSPVAVPEIARLRVPWIQAPENCDGSLRL